AAPVCLDCFFEHCDGVANLLWRSILAEQQIVALLGHLADRALAAGAHPDRRGRVLCPPRAAPPPVVGPAGAALPGNGRSRSTPCGAPRGTRRSARRPPPSAHRNRRTRCTGIPCRCRNRAGPRTAGRAWLLAPPTTRDCARAARAPRCPGAASACVRQARSAG